MAKKYVITRANGWSYLIEADYYDLDAGVYYFYMRDADYVSHKVHEVNMLDIKSIERERNNDV